MRVINPQWNRKDTGDMALVVLVTVRLFKIYQIHTSLSNNELHVTWSIILFLPTSLEYQYRGHSFIFNIKIFQNAIMQSKAWTFAASCLFVLAQFREFQQLYTFRSRREISTTWVHNSLQRNEVRRRWQRRTSLNTGIPTEHFKERNRERHRAIGSEIAQLLISLLQRRIDHLESVVIV